jgi:hypothetical protein
MFTKRGFAGQHYLRLSPSLIFPYLTAILFALSAYTNDKLFWWDFLCLIVTVASVQSFSGYLLVTSETGWPANRYVVLLENCFTGMVSFQVCIHVWNLRIEHVSGYPLSIGYTSVGLLSLFIVMICRSTFRADWQEWREASGLTKNLFHFAIPSRWRQADEDSTQTGRRTDWFHIYNFFAEWLDCMAFLSLFASADSDMDWMVVPFYILFVANLVLFESGHAFWRGEAGGGRVERWIGERAEICVPFESPSRHCRGVRQSQRDWRSLRGSSGHARAADVPDLL